MRSAVPSVLYFSLRLLSSSPHLYLRSCRPITIRNQQVRLLPQFLAYWLLWTKPEAILSYLPLTPSHLASACSSNKSSSCELCPIPSVLHFMAHTYTYNPRGMHPSGTTISAYIPGGLLPPGKTLKLSGTTVSGCMPGSLLQTRKTRSTCNHRGRLSSGTTSSICSPKGMLPLGTIKPAKTKDNQSA